MNKITEVIEVKLNSSSDFIMPFLGYSCLPWNKAKIKKVISNNSFKSALDKAIGSNETNENFLLLESIENEDIQTEVTEVNDNQTDENDLQIGSIHHVSKNTRKPLFPGARYIKNSLLLYSIF